MAFDEVRSLREEYEAAQDSAQEKREAYHSAVRTLYMSGISLREIAEQLGLSHQRVHKIVGLEPVKRKKRRIGAVFSLLISLIATGLFAFTSVGTSWALADELKNVDHLALTLHEGVTQDEVMELEFVIEQDPLVERFIFVPEIATFRAWGGPRGEEAHTSRRQTRRNPDCGRCRQHVGIHRHRNSFHQDSSQTFQGAKKTEGSSVFHLEHTPKSQPTTLQPKTSISEV